ncbi:MAG: response regulator transcription factor [Proteobacteria bacterium]|nr:response regulator transcription factor [Pseudomonadota bacterium]
MRLLLVEDDRMIGESLVKGLRDVGNRSAFAVDWVRDGAAALAALKDRRAEFSLVVLDWNLPRQDGLSVLQAVRASGSTLPILMVTARDGLNDRVTGLDNGADDYLVKPFELAELKARIRNLLRRAQGRPTAQISHGNLVLDTVTHTVRRGDGAVLLSGREFALLHSLLERPGAILSRTQLEERLYGWDESVQSNAIEFVIHSLRKKLGAEIIDNVRGVGWRIGLLP